MAHFTDGETKSLGKDEPRPRLCTVNGGASSVTQQIDAQWGTQFQIPEGRDIPWKLTGREYQCPGGGSREGAGAVLEP